MIRPTCWLAPLLLVMAAGCGESPPAQVPVFPVSGQVTYGGKPAAGVKVYLLPTTAPKRPAIPQNPHGVTDSEGKFTLSTYAPADGAAAGGYQIALFWPEEQGESQEESGSDRLMTWYDPAHTKLTATVPEGGAVLPPIALPAVAAPPAEMQGIPGKN